MPKRGGTTAGVKQLETLLREHCWGEAMELLATGLSARQLRRGPSFTVDGRQVEVLAALLAAGADADRDCALFHAVKANWREGVEILLAAGVDPGRGPLVESPLSAAIAHQNDPLGALLVRHGASLLNPATRQPLLLRAVYLGLIETVRAMLSRRGDPGSDPDTRGMLKKTLMPGSLTETIHVLFADAPAVVIAAACGQLEILAALVEAGADLDASDDAGRTALAVAREQGHAEVAAWLEARGAPAEVRRSPEDELFAALDARDLAAVERLLAAGVSPDTPDPRGLSRGRPPLVTAVAAEWPELLEVLLAAGADVDRRDDDQERRLTILGPARPADLVRDLNRRGMTPLMYAALLDRPEAVRRLLAAGARSDLLDFTRHTALMLAAANGRTAAVEALLAGGADPDLRGAERAPALHLAVADSHTAAAIALVRAGADPRLRDDNGETAAAMAELLEIAPLLDAIAAGGASRPKRRASPSARKRGGITVPPKPAAAPARDLSAYATEAVRERCRNAAGPALLAAADELAQQLGVAPSDQRHEDGRIELPLPMLPEIDLGELQREMLVRGCFLFAAEDTTGRPSRLALLPTTDPLEAVALVGVGEAGVEGSSAAVIAWLAGSPEPWQVTTITYNTLAGRFLAPLADPEAAASAAAAIFAVCPDAVYQGAGDIETLADELAATGRFYLWWD